MPNSHVFISYIREDTARVDQLQRTLEAAGIAVWRDTSALKPGQDWKAEIRAAITAGMAFIACFSENTELRRSSVLFDELAVAVEQMRLRRPGEAWLIPIRFGESSMPDIDLGFGRTLHSLQRVDLFGDNRELEVARLIASIRVVGAEQADRHDESSNGDVLAMTSDEGTGNAAQTRSVDNSSKQPLRSSGESDPSYADSLTPPTAGRPLLLNPPLPPERSMADDLMRAVLAAKYQVDIIQRAIDNAFGGSFSATARPSATREIEYEAVTFPFGWNPDNNTDVPIRIVKSHPHREPLGTYDWNDWTDHVQRDIGADYSLLITEQRPAAELRNSLVSADEHVWYRPKWFDTSTPKDEKPMLHRLDVLVYLPQGSGYCDNQRKLAIAREIIQRHISEERDKELERRTEAELEAQAKAASLSLVEGDTVNHDRYGSGKVTSIYASGAEATIEFGAGVGVKKLLLGYAPLKKAR